MIRQKKPSPVCGRGLGEGVALALAATVLTLLFLTASAQADQDTYLNVERGRALATAGDCIACHTAPNRPAFSGGRPLETPFGNINTANLTPDPETGLGTWNTDEFYRAMHHGISKNGAYLYPAFPYPYYTKVTRDDSDAIFAYLRTLPPVSNQVDRNTLPFPFNIRTSMLAWNAMFFTPGNFHPDPAHSEEWNRGAYLVEGLGHCGACHTPMNTLGGSKSSQPLQGNVIQSWLAPNITGDSRIGVGGWGVDDIVEYLRTGRNKIAAASGPMAEVVQFSTSLMPEPDLRAIATYLRDTNAPPRANPNLAAPIPAPGPAPIPSTDAVMQTGRSIYLDTCSACHTAKGEGVELLFPRLAGAPGVQQPDPTTLIRVVISGARTAATNAAPTAPAMPSLGWRLDDAQVAAVLTYVRNSWGNAAPAVSASEVARMRSRVTGR